MDPLTALEVFVRGLVTAVLLLSAFALMTLVERRLIAKFQWRIGPNRAGGPLGGLLQPAADGLKLLFKEQLIPAGARRFIYLMAPCISLIVALTSFSVIPVHLSEGALQTPVGAPEIQGTHWFQIADINVGVLFLLGITSLSVYGIVLGGWASGNKYALIGAVRSTAQMVSYELALGSALLSPLMMVGSLSFAQIAVYQKGNWLLFAQPMAFLLFCVAAIAETNRAPFDLPEAEQELGAGFHTEYSGMRFALFFMAEYVAMITVSAVATTVFLGGPYLPFFDFQHGLIFLVKIALFMFAFIWLRATLPRYRYDQLMRIGWQVLLPLSLLNLAITMVGVVLDWQRPWHYLFVIVSVVMLLYAFAKLNRRREGDAAHH
jgi:NADH-quinone oxidoreductase subunit H